MQLHIKNMTCGGCARSVTKVIQSVDATARVEADLSTRRVEVTSSRTQSEIEAVLAEAGYPALQVA